MSWQGLESTDQALAKEGVQWIDWNMLCGDAEQPLFAQQHLKP